MSFTSAYSKYQYFLTSSPAPYVAHIQINRPTKLNAFKEAMWLELRTLFNQLSVDPDVRAVVLSGAGDKAFTAGLDVTEASQNGLLNPEGNLDGARKAAKLRRHIAEFQECITAVEKCEKPVIAVMHGISIGLAIDISCCADVRVCAANTRFAVKEVDIGLAADIGTLARLPKVVGSFSWVKDIALSARDFGAEEALRVGFVSQVHESKEKAVEAAVRMAAFIGGKSPVAVQGTKEVLNHARDHAVEENLKYVGIWNAAALQTGDVQAALLSGMQKRKPTFEKL
ncbi:ClpP/crotonase-like domain-containing protein [Cercophora samala]|uniref:ClpP/crotonase-like domain-containing protein n=1 Tax=Cercophora samala TaxID=330535 RepID=A0AA39ZDQ5_9PEZI|nr:ClpP/crotonase-like domain-containing protein [Cercophora samala]